MIWQMEMDFDGGVQKLLDFMAKMLPTNESEEDNVNMLSEALHKSNWKFLDYLQESDLIVPKILGNGRPSLRVVAESLEKKQVIGAIAMASRFFFKSDDASRIVLGKTIVDELGEASRFVRGRIPTGGSQEAFEFARNIRQHFNRFKEIFEQLDAAITAGTYIAYQRGWFVLGLSLCLGVEFRVDPEALIWWPKLTEEAESERRYQAIEILLSSLAQPQGLAAVSDHLGVLHETAKLLLTPELASDPTPIKCWSSHLAYAKSPDFFSPSVFWTPYWALIKTCQKFAKSMTAFAQEDVATGALCTYLEQSLSGWATECFGDFYEQSKPIFDLYSLRLASSKGEMLTKSDFAIIVNIDLPGFCLKKYIMFQAKTSRGGSADVFSKGRQLTKLYERNRDYRQNIAVYAFYHDQRFGCFPSITIDTPVAIIEKLSGLNESQPEKWARKIQEMKDAKAPTWHADSLLLCKNFPEFFVFDFLRAGSGFGGHWEDLEEAFDGLTISDELLEEPVLPEYLHVLSVGRPVDRDKILENVNRVMGRPEIGVRHQRVLPLPPELNDLRKDLLRERKALDEQRQALRETPPRAKDDKGPEGPGFGSR